MTPTLLPLFDQYRAHVSTDDAAATLVLAQIQLAEKALSNGESPAKRSEYLTIKQAARQFNISERALYRLTELHRRNGKSIRLKCAELQAYLDGEGTKLHG